MKGLVLEVSDTGKDHCHFMLIAIVDRVLVLDRSPRLNNRLNTVLIGDLNTIREWEESIRGHHRTFELETESRGFLYRLLQRIHARGLSHTACQ